MKGKISRQHHAARATARVVLTHERKEQDNTQEMNWTFSSLKGKQIDQAQQGNHRKHTRAPPPALGPRGEHQRLFFSSLRVSGTSTESHACTTAASPYSTVPRTQQHEYADPPTHTCAPPTHLPVCGMLLHRAPRQLLSLSLGPPVIWILKKPPSACS